MTRRLIVNADGFGFGPGATEGILDAVRAGGFISSISVNANFPDVERVRELVAEFPHISVGVHLNPMVGQPCLGSQVPSLIDAAGNFHNSRFFRLLYLGKISETELEAEFNAQVARVRQLVGDRLTHLDSQANSHLNYLDMFLRIAKRWGLCRMRNNASLVCLEAAEPRTARLRTYLTKPHVWLVHCYRQRQMEKARAAGMHMADMLITVGYAGTGNKARYENWARILRNLPDGTFEIYCHPAYPDDTLRRWSYYLDERQRELEVLKNSALRKLAADAGVELVAFDAV